MRATSGLVAFFGFGKIVTSQSSLPTTDLSTRSINVPLNCNEDYTYMGYHSFNLSTPFNTQRCADWCNSTSQYNLEHLPQDVVQPPQLCRFYNTYILVNNTVPQEQVCAMYTQYWDPAVYAVNSGYTDLEGNNLTITSSFFSSNSTPAVNPICPTDIPRLSEDRVAGAFCRSAISYTGASSSAGVATTTRTETVQACRSTGAAARLFRVRRQDGNSAPIQGVAAFYPEKLNATTTGDPVLVTIPGKYLLSPGIYSAAASLAVNALASNASQATDIAAAAPASLVVSLLTSNAPEATESVVSTSTVTSTVTSTSLSVSVFTSTKSQSTPVGPIVKRQVTSLAPEVVSSLLQAISPTTTTSVAVVVVTDTTVVTSAPVVVVTATSVVTTVPVVVVTATNVVTPPSAEASTLSVVASSSSSISSAPSAASSSLAVPASSLVGSPLSTVPSNSSAASTTSSASATSSSILASTVSSNSSASSTSQVQIPTPSAFIGREAREIASVCSRIVTATGTEEAVATVTDYSDCNLRPTTCDNGTSTARLIAGSFTNSTEDIDDAYYQVDLDFPICIYDDCSTRVFPTTNGLLSLGTQNVGINDYVNRQLPAESGQGVLSAYWDDLYIHKGQSQYMDYSVCGPNGNRTVTFDWRMGRYNASSNGPLYSWSATFYEDRPSRVFLKYFNTTDQGASATVGIEGRTNGTGKSGRVLNRNGDADSNVEEFFQYSFQQPVITDGLGLVFDPRKRYFGQANAEPNAS
jgi:hypothetical protein